MASNSPATSVLQYFYEPRGAQGHKCGYCSGEDCNISNGMWLHELACADYQELVDRGWRRCGKYSYKPVMNKTCCPMYAINCEALKFKLSKSQKKVLIKLRKYIETGSVKDPPLAPPPLPGDDYEKVSAKTKKCAQETHIAATTTNATSDESSKLPEVQTCVNQPCAEWEDSTKVVSRESEDVTPEPVPVRRAEEKKKLQSMDASAVLCDAQMCDTQPCMEVEDSTKVVSQESEAATPEPIPFRRVKKKKKKKLQSMDAAAVPHSAQVKKTVEDFLSLDAPMSGKEHQLAVKLVQSSPRTKEFNESFAESFALYKKYQMAVHNDKEEDCTKDQFTRFLVDSSLARAPSGGTGPEYGSYHQQYYLDGKLVMVGVVDILPRCLSSVYVYYDPAIMFLSPGVVSALYEIAYTRMLHTVIPSLDVYCMGYYVHDCQKMRYKGQYYPSFLLCPETYRWQPIEKCLPKLEQSKYARLEEEEGHTAEPVEDYLQDVLFLDGGREKSISYGSLKVMLGMGVLPRAFEDHVREYATLVGKCVSTRAAIIVR